MVEKSKGFLRQNWYQVLSVLILIFTCGSIWGKMTTIQANMVPLADYCVVREKVTAQEKAIDRLVSKMDYLANVIIENSK